MLLQVMPEQVIRLKPIIKEAVDKAIPPIKGESAQKFNNIMTGLLSGRFVGWIVYRQLAGRKKSIGFMITTIVYDEVTETKSLLVYCLYVYERSVANDWIEGLEALEKYALSKGCVRITGMIMDDALLRRVVMLGGGVDYHFISIPLRRNR